jgi:hypothetical protein
MNEVSEMLARIKLFERLDVRQLAHLSSRLKKLQLARGD